MLQSNAQDFRDIRSGLDAAIGHSSRDESKFARSDSDACGHDLARQTKEDREAARGSDLAPAGYVPLLDFKERIPNE